MIVQDTHTHTTVFMWRQLRDGDIAPGYIVGGIPSVQHKQGRHDAGVTNIALSDHVTPCDHCMAPSEADSA